MKIKILAVALLHFACCLTALPAVKRHWTHNGIQYTFFDTPARVERYNLDTRLWMSPITFTGVLQDGWVDASGIYVGLTRTLHRCDLDGANLTPVLNTTGDISGIVGNADFVYLQHGTPGWYSTKVLSVRKSNLTPVEEKQFSYGLTGMTITPEGDKIIGRNAGLSPSDIVLVRLNANGTLGTQSDSPAHGDYPGATRTYMFPGGQRVMDDSGTVYSTSDLTYLKSMGGSLATACFIPETGLPVVLRGSSLIAYNSFLLPTGSFTLSGGTGFALAPSGNSVAVFRENASAANGLSVELVTLASLQAPAPGAPASPLGLAYTPTAVLLDEARATLYLVSKENQSIFRWSLASRSYQATIPLLGSPSHATFNPVTGMLFTGYASGLIHRIDPSATNPVETVFAALPGAVLGMHHAGQNLVAVDDSGAWETHWVFSPDGTTRAQDDWNHPSQTFEWSPTDSRLYYFRDNSSPNDLMHERIDPNTGALSARGESPYHGDYPIAHPIRASANGSLVALGSGVIFAAPTLTKHPYALANAVTDLVWTGGDLASIRLIAGSTQLQLWRQPSFLEQTAVTRQIPGTPLRLLRTGNPARPLLMVQLSAGIPRFEFVHESTFAILPPDALTAPANLTHTMPSLSSCTLSWTDGSGEERYDVERRQNGGAWTFLASAGVNTTTLTDGPLLAGSLYEYRVRAVNGTLVSPDSLVRPVDLRRPSSPAGLVASAITSSSLRLDWADTVRETAYDVEYRLLPSGSFAVSATLAADATSHVVTGLLPNRSYQIRVTARNTYGAEAPAEIASVTTLEAVPVTPAGLAAASVSTRFVELTWNPVGNETHFVLERAATAGGPWSWSTNVPAATVRFRVLNLTPGTAYAFRLRAVNAMGSSAPSPVVSVVTAVLSPAVNFSARPLNAQGIALAWSAPAFPATQEIQRSSDEGATWSTLGLFAPGVTAATDGPLSGDVEIFYRIRSVFAGDASAWSPVVSARPSANFVILEDDFDPDADTLMWESITGGATANHGTGFGESRVLYFAGSSLTRAATTKAVNLGGSSATLTFVLRAGNEGVDGSLYWNNSESGEGVVVEYSLNGGTWTSLRSINTVYPAASAWAPHSVTLPAGLQGALRLRWRQLTHSGSTFDTWAIDNVRLAQQVTVEPPFAPADVEAELVSFRSVLVTWLPGENAAAYDIQRRELPSGAWTVIASSVTGTSHTDPAAPVDQNLAYRILSRNAGGWSAPSVVEAFVSTERKSTAWAAAHKPADQDWHAKGANGLDYLTNLACNLDPDAPAGRLNGGSGYPSLELGANGRLEARFLRARGLLGSELVYRVQVCDDLASGTWVDAGSIISVTVVDANWEELRWRDSSAGMPFRLVRVVFEMR